MHINVRYQPDFPTSFRLSLYRVRRRAWILAAFGVLLILLATQLPAGSAWFFYTVGIVYVILVPVVLSMRLYRGRELFRQEVEVTLTSEDIEWHTEGATLRAAWEKVERVDESKLGWIFITKKPPMFIVLGKRRLSQEQQAELASFLGARHLDRRVRKMTPAQEAAYSLAYGTARADLKPEVQAEYDRLVAERGPE